MAFSDRVHAGRRLAAELQEYAGRGDVTVLGLPRGGVPVAREVATALGAPLDVFVVRKLGLPGHRELAVGAVASGGVRVVNDAVVPRHRVSPELLDRLEAAEEPELARREKAYRGDRPLHPLAGRTAIVVDDGLATGATMRAALTAIRRLGAQCVVCAVPVAPPDASRGLADVADRVVVVESPAWFAAVGQFYDDFRQTGDDEVRACLADKPADTG